MSSSQEGALAVACRAANGVQPEVPYPLAEACRAVKKLLSLAKACRAASDLQQIPLVHLQWRAEWSRICCHVATQPLYNVMLEVKTRKTRISVRREMSDAYTSIRKANKCEEICGW